MFYFQIIPLTKLSAKKSPVFTYAFNAKIAKGTLVNIPFGEKNLRGIVLEETKKPFFKVKFIKKIIQPEILSQNQINLAIKISDYYCTCLGTTLKYFIPKITKQDLQINSLKKENSKILLTANQKKALLQIENSSAKQFLLFGPASSGKTEIIMRLIESALKKKVQTLVLIPEIFLSYQEIERYQKRFGSTVCLIHSHLSATEFSSNYQAIATGKIKVILSTRLGIFLPFKNLENVIIDEEQDISHKQWEQNPRYHVREIAPIISQIYKARIIYVSATASLECLYRQEQKIITLIKLPLLKTKKFSVKPPEIQLVDLKKYYIQNKKGVIISQELKSAIKTNLTEKKTVLLLVSRRGKGRYVICNDCKKPLSCPHCQTNLVQFEDHYRCLHCSYTQPSFTKCPHCKSFRLKNIGFGTQSLADEISLLFPYAKIKIADSDTFLKEVDRKEIFTRLKNNQLDILIGTPTIAKGFDLPNVSLVAILNAEEWSGQSDFRFDERWLSHLFQLAGRVNRPGSDQKGLCLIQTWQPENKVYNFIKDWDWLAFAQKELIHRQALGYCPFTNLIKLSFKDVNLKKVEKEAEKMYNKILQASLSDILSLSEPYYGSLKKIRDKYYKHLVIKTAQWPSEKLVNFIKANADNWSVDINPENIF